VRAPARAFAGYWPAPPRPRPRTSLTNRLATHTEAVLHRPARPIDPFREVRRQRRILGALRADRLPHGVIALVTVVRE